MTWEAYENSQRLIIKTFAQLETGSQGITLLRVLRVRACHVDFPPEVENNFVPAAARTATPTRCTGMTTLFERGALGGSRARAGGLPNRARKWLPGFSFRARSDTKHPTTALPEQPKITLIAAYAEHLERANFSTTSAALAPLSMGLVMPLASSRARVR
jgi:hypothetical protein